MEAIHLASSPGIALISPNASQPVKRAPFAILPARRAAISFHGPSYFPHGRAITSNARAWKGPVCSIQAAAKVVDESKGSSETGSDLRRKKLAVFVSGGGSNFRSIHQAAAQGVIHGDVVVLVTDKPGCGGAAYAAENGISVVYFPKSKYSPAGLSAAELVATLRKVEIDFVLLAGYLKLLPTELVQAFTKSILNIHPSLLPAFGGKGFYGMKVHQAVIASGARYSGPTIHYVDENYDTGRILAQKAVPVLANDTADQLAARVLCEEHKLYVDVVCALCEERIFWREDGVPLIQNKGNPNEYT